MGFVKSLLALVAWVLDLFPMKQLTLLTIILLVCGVASLFHPFWAVLMYYGFAILRPQHLWEWALPYEIRWSMIAAVTVFISLGMNFSKVIHKGRINAVAVLMGLYGLLLLMSMLTAHDPAVAQHWGIEYIKVLVMALVSSIIINRLWHVKALAIVILAGLGYIAWEVNYLYIINQRLDIFHYGFAGFDNNGAGIMLAMGLPFAYVFGVGANKWWYRAIAWFVGVILLHALLMTYSRGAMISAIIGGGWLLIHYRSRIKAASIAIGLCVVISVLAGQEIRERFLSTSDYKVDGSAQSRLDSWGAAWKIAMEHPLTGQGIRNSSIYIQNYGADRRGRTIHSQYLQLAADSGLPAMAVFIAMLLTSIVMLGRTRKICAAYLLSCGGPLRSLSPPESELAQAEQIALGCQTCLIIFATGGLFLSLEIVELPWLIMVMAGVMPAALTHHLHSMGVTIRSDRKRRTRSSGSITPPRPATIPAIPHGLVTR